MNINRHTCEAWFLDYYEGTLSSEQVAELFAFLDLHPDLRELFNNYEGPAFASEDLDLPRFEGKELLKKVSSLPDNINEVNYEEYFVAAVEHELDAKGHEELRQFLQQHPEKQRELTLFHATVLTPDQTIVFDGKAELKKQVFTVTAENFDEVAVAALDGELNTLELAAFNRFLAAEPSFRADYELFTRTQLQPDTSVVFEGKADLKKQAAIITADNVVEYLVAAVDGSLNATEQAALEAFTAKHPEWNAEFVAYQKTKLTADTSVVFEGKAELKKQAAIITADNVAEYLVAAVDGSLNATEQATLEAFTAKHPEWNAEFVAYQKTKLTADTSVVFEGKAELKKQAAIITADNVAEYAVAAMDGELSVADQQLFAAYTAQHPEAAQLVVAYASTRLTPDMAVVFADKDSLRQRKGGIVWFSPSVRYAAAAAVLLFIVTFWWMKGDNVATTQSGVAANGKNRIQLPLFDSAFGQQQQQETQVAQTGQDPNAPAQQPDGQRPNKSLPQPAQRRELLASIDPRRVNRIQPNRQMPEIQQLRLHPIAVDEPGVAYQSTSSSSSTETITATQYAMRWTKAKLDAGATKGDEYPSTTMGARQQKVTALDLAGSALSRVGKATGLRLGLKRNTLDGTILNVGKYNVRLSSGENTSAN